MNTDNYKLTHRQCIATATTDLGLGGDVPCPQYLIHLKAFLKNVYLTALNLADFSLITRQPFMAVVSDWEIGHGKL